jgi:hypothetical protein
MKVNTYVDCGVVGMLVKVRDVSPITVVSIVYTIPLSILNEGTADRVCVDEKLSDVCAALKTPGMATVSDERPITI